MYDIDSGTEYIDPPPWGEMADRGEIVNRGGHHEPDSYGRLRLDRDDNGNCGCEPQTDGGYAYRDMTIEDGSLTVHYYHQSPIVTEVSQFGTVWQVSSCGYNTPTTKARINRYLPSGFKVFQTAFDWRLSTPTDDIVFEDPMVISTSDL